VTALAHWQDRAIALFGKDPNQWKFQCPTCFLVQSRADFLALGLYPNQVDLFVGYSCIRRWTDQGCMSTKSGPIQLNISPGEVRPTFDWATT